MRASEKLSSRLFDVSEKEKGEMLVQLNGSIDLKTSASILKQLHSEIKAKPPSSLTINLDQVSYFDDFGALLLFELRNEMTTQNGSFKIINVPDKVQEILSLVNFDSHDECFLVEKRRSENVIVQLGDSTLKEAYNIKFLISFVGSVFLSFIHVFRHPKSLRIDDIVVNMEKTGVNALPIVGLISLLLGLVMAFTSALQLRQFGANIYVAALVTLAMVSELGPIITAIIVAGRSGSAFAAEIGTMKISEEIDALVTMGFDPTLFLAIPRIVASIIVVPLLTLFSNIFSIAGGLIVGVTMLDLTASAYISKTIETLTFFEVTWGMGKSVVFAFLVSWIGCLRGFQTRGGADAVGNAATSAVVSGIFLIILFDSVFAVIRSYW
jgi:phospholipid/cholesterol/gamma-HCH transport system permease protein